MNGKKSDVHVKGDGTTEVKLTPMEERKEFKEEEYKEEKAQRRRVHKIDQQRGVHRIGVQTRVQHRRVQRR